MLLAVAFSFGVGAVPHRELPATFIAGRAFVMPRVAESRRRLALWLDSGGDGLLRSTTVSQLHLETTPQHTAYLPKLDETGFPAIAANHGALPILDDAKVADDPIFSGVDGQLGWTWLADRIWSIDYVGHHLYQDFSAPSYPSRDRVPLQFDAAGRYPDLQIEIAGTSYRAVLDTAASVALSPQTLQRMSDGVPAVRATSFIPKRTLEAWHAAHPQWPYIGDAGIAKGVSMIEVPQVRADRVVFSNVWFSTRPNDDVFAGESVDAKLGPSAYGHCAVTIDYVHAEAGFECTGETTAAP